MGTRRGHPAGRQVLPELERAGIIRPVEPAITAYGPYGRPTRLMEITEPYLNPMLRALKADYRGRRG